MIYDSIKNHHYYHSLNNKFKTAFEYLLNIDTDNIEVGSYNIQGSDIIANIGIYKTKSKAEASWESHQKYIDIQYIVKGSELIGFSHLNRMDITEKYSSINDIQFHSGEGDFLRLTKGNFIIFSPGELHMPAIQIDESEEVIKIVMKIKI